ncbi:hypothetical protein [Curtobacterium sp. CFBP9011]|uniref:hypothetical protein n=1 Tax=Curtobacterium sp. CFBP9011 TaxID=3096530 RepID=UPI002A6AF2FE|nr:hypothetical protein [Curtobacterium sp. CFBP9011]MDY1004425.1 hypothetical protein [Curtobacterium sp. CFBP9011]
MQKKCTLITAAAGLVLALGAPVVGSLPAMAATAPTSSVSAAATTPELGSGGHVFAHGIVTLTSAVYDQGRISVEGVITERVRDVQIAAGHGYQAGKVGAGGHFSASVASDSPSFELRFGTKVNSYNFATVESVLWSAVAPGTPPETPGPRPTLTPLPVPADPNPAPEPQPQPEQDAKQPGMPNVLSVTGTEAGWTNDFETGAVESLFTAYDHARREATVTRPTDGTLHVQQSSDGVTFTDRATYTAGGGIGKFTDIDVTLPAGHDYLEYKMWVEDSSGRKSEAQKFFVQEFPARN